jgi:hypothetical protein
LLVVCNGRAFQIDDPRDLQEVDLRHGGAFLKGGFTWDAQVMAEHILVQDMGCRPAISLRAEAMKISEEWRRARASSLVNSAAPASGRKDPQ